MTYSIHEKFTEVIYNDGSKKVVMEREVEGLKRAGLLKGHKADNSIPGEGLYSRVRELARNGHFKNAEKVAGNDKRLRAVVNAFRKSGDKSEVVFADGHRGVVLKSEVKGLEDAGFLSGAKDAEPMESKSKRPVNISSSSVKKVKEKEEKDQGETKEDKQTGKTK